MRLPEQRLWDRMQRNVHGADAIRLERIENMVGSGFPDVWAISLGIVTPIELKAVDTLPMRAGTRLIPSGKGLNTDQRNWHLDWQNHGGRSLIVLSAGSEGARMHFAVRGDRADEVNDWPLAHWKAETRLNAKTPQFWYDLRALLRTEA